MAAEAAVTSKANEENKAPIFDLVPQTIDVKVKESFTGEYLKGMLK